MLVHESLQLLCNASGLSEESNSQITSLLVSIADKCLCDIHEMLLKNKELEFYIKYVDWILDEVALFKLHEDYSFSALNNSFQDLYIVEPELIFQAINITGTGSSSDPLNASLLKYKFFHDTGGQDIIEELLRINKYAFTLHQYHIETLTNEKKIREALNYAKEYLEFVSGEFEYLSNLPYEDREARLDSFPDRHINPFMIWCTRVVINTLIYLKEYQEASDYILEMFTYTSKSGTIGRLSGDLRVKSYVAIADTMPDEARKMLSEKFFKIAETLPLSYDLEQICEIENNWLPLIKAYKKRLSISAIFYSYEFRKKILNKYPDELNESLAFAFSNFVKKGTDRERRREVEKGLEKFLKLKGGKPYVFELIYEFKEQYTRRKVFLELIDSFMEQHRLNEEYEPYVHEKLNG